VGASEIGGAWAVVLAGLFSIGCGDDVGGVDGATDAAADGAGADAGLAAPDIPWLAEGAPPIGIAPCPMGWREVDDGVVTTCDPYPEAGAVPCPFGEAHFPGEASCAAIGEACPPGDFAMGLPTGTPVVYVKADAAGGGDGTVASPYATLAEVPWLSLAAGTTVALAKGTYEGTLSLNPAVRLVGACVAETRLTGVASAVPAVIRVARAGDAAFVGSLAIVGAPQVGVLVENGQALTLEGVLVEGSRSLGVEVLGAGTVLSARGLVVRDTRPGSVSPGVGLYVANGARAEATRAVISGNQQAGVFAAGAGEIVLSDAAVRDNRGRDADGFFGRGVSIQEGSTFRGERLIVSGNHEVGLQAGSNCELVLSDVVVRDTQAQESDGEAGMGINVEDGARLEAARLLVSHSRTVGVAATTDVVMVLSDVVVRDTQGRQSDGTHGRGINLDERVMFQADRLVVMGNRNIGLAATVNSVLVLTDVVVRDTQSRQSDGEFGRGVNVETGSRLEATRLAIIGNREVGLAAEGAEVSLTDVVVQNTLPRESDLAFGYGVGMQRGARLSGTRVAVDGAREIGLNTIHGAVVDLSQLSVTNIVGTEGAEADRMHGHAVTALGASVHLTGFAIRSPATCGLFIAHSGETAPALDVEGGVVEGAAIGACVQVDGYDLGRLTRDVVYRDNGVNLDSTTLPVPGAPDTVAP